MQPLFVSSRCMAEAAPLSNFVMKVIIHMLMFYITIESVFGTARQGAVIYPKETKLLFPWKLNLLRENLQPLPAKPPVSTYSIISMHVSFSNGMELSLCETDVNEITALLHKIVG